VTHRYDILADITRVAPTFGLGLMATPSKHIVVDLGFEYYIGYGKSNHLPVRDFVPFAYGIYLRVGYKFL